MFVATNSSRIDLWGVTPPQVRQRAPGARWLTLLVCLQAQSIAAYLDQLARAPLESAMAAVWALSSQLFSAHGRRVTQAGASAFDGRLSRRPARDWLVSWPDPLAALLGGHGARGARDAGVRANVISPLPTHPTRRADGQRRVLQEREQHPEQPASARRHV
jgi:hypothetical protein